jgi:hypothetical protein
MQDPAVKRTIILLVVIGIAAYGLFFLQISLSKRNAAKPTPTPVAAASGNIIITSPHSGDPVPQDFIVAGKTKVGTNFINMKVSNPLTGKVYFNARFKPKATPGVYADFGAKISLQQNDTSRSSLISHDKLLLEVSQSASDTDSPHDTIQIPVLFSPDLP